MGSMKSSTSSGIKWANHGFWVLVVLWRNELKAIPTWLFFNFWLFFIFKETQEIVKIK